MFEEGAPDGFRTSARVDLGSLEANYRSIEALVPPGTALLCVIKANAYGHGAVATGKKLESMGVRHLAVATIDEGIELRENGISGSILLLSGIMPWEDVASAIDHDLTPTIINSDMLDRIEAFEGAGRVKVHIKIDTGMGRLGFGPGEVGVLADKLARSDRIEVEGIMSHFASSDKRDGYGFGQVEAFRDAVGSLKDRGIEPRFLHMANSGAICCFPEAHFNMVRPGIMLYGSYPDPARQSMIRLKPVMKWASKVAFVRLFGARSSLSYGRTFVTDRETRVAYVPVGYADGYPRSLSNRGSVLMKGSRCKVLGTVCMEWIFVDVTHLPDVGPGEEVVLMGGAGEGAVTADEIAVQTGTIPYEILCGLSRRIPRLYV